MISIITPTYNRKNMLEEMIRSVMSQTEKDIELIIIDDCSTDGTDKMLENYLQNPWIQYVCNKRNMKDPGYSRHKGFMLSKGDYIVFMDDDDYYIDHTFLSRAKEVFRSQEGLAMVSGCAYIEYVNRGGCRKKEEIGCEGRIRGKEFILEIGKKYKKPLSTFSTLFSRKMLHEADLDHMEMVNDYAIYLRALIYGDAYILPNYIGVYRLHSTNISKTMPIEFIMKNMKERIWCREKLIETEKKHRVTMWWNRQVRILLSYYLCETIPSIDEEKQVIKWFDENSTRNISYRVIILYCKILGVAVREKRKEEPIS